MHKLILLVTALQVLALGVAQTTQPVFKHGEAQVVQAFANASEWIQEELWVETEFDSDSNGRMDRMHVFLTRPRQTQTEGLKLPIVYMTSPYFAGTGGNSKDFFWDVEHELGATPPPHKNAVAKRRTSRPFDCFFQDRAWVPRGYITVYSSSPGTGFSDGVPTIGGKNETLAPKAVIDWLCGRAVGYTSRTGQDTVSAFWSTGKIGMMGTSYNGTLCLAAACTGVEGLEAIIPNAPVSSWYMYYRSNGLVRSPGGYLGEDTDVLYDFIHSGDPENRAYNDSLVRDRILVPGQDRQTGDFNAFWAERDYLPQMDSMKAALFMCHGFEDWNVMAEHSYRVYRRAVELGLPARIYYNQLGHGYPAPMWMMNRWFTRFLHGVDNGIERAPKAWIVPKGEREARPQADFPHPNAQKERLYLHATDEYNGSLRREKSSSTPLSWIDNARKSAEQLLNRKSEHRLLFVTDPLEQQLHFSGTSTIHLRVSADRSAANISVYLVEIPADAKKGKLKLKKCVINRAWADPQNHQDLAAGEALVPGQYYDLTFDFQPDDQIVPAGSKLALLIFSSDSEFTIQPKKGTVLSIDPAQSWLDVMVVR